MFNVHKVKYLIVGGYALAFHGAPRYTGDIDLFVKPYTASMGDGLFEIRAKGKEGIGRSLFCTIKGQEIIILHSFIKKSKKTPKKEIDLARKRMKEVKQP